MAASNGPDRVLAYISWPSAPLIESLVRSALNTVPILETTDAAPASDFNGRIVQWATYDNIDHDLIHAHPSYTLSSSYVFRKALIRKHYLSRSIYAYLVKHPESPLCAAVPRTWELEISFADELEDMWSDELWDLGEAMEHDSDAWWILKPGMADRGMGIRLFDNKETLQDIFEEFDDDSDEDGDRDDDDTAVVTSQLRHFVIQEYIDSPLLFDPREVPLGDREPPSVNALEGHKFHLRVYCVASGALRVYLYRRILALFSSKPYAPPKIADDEDGTLVDLSAHLTNTSLQAHRGEEGVRLFDELIGCHILSGEGAGRMLTAEHVQNIQDQCADALAEVFRAALETPVHFQPVPNAFELFGVDFLVSHEKSSDFQVKLLEINAEPAIELTGPRLTWILEDLFKSIAEVAIRPFVSQQQEYAAEWKVGDTRHHLRKCLDTEIRDAASW
ncbi:TTL-domain-containing protein [Vararia minispora EC-137]|uniref:TTL-domain-containing protein n=1 Tax=Vararia minispora EC-137 TaxID=1314806 RepID=A0ACB8QPF8_9AGAM|nr:TTL-domain-containing protein [Vararia minispora EC-137]